MTLLRQILWNAAKHPFRTAVVDDRGARSYGACLIASMMFSRLIERETGKDTIGILLPTSGGTPLAMLGAWLAYRVPVPLNFLLGKDELQYVILHSGMDTILTVQAMLDFIGGRDVIPPGIKVVLLEEALPKIGKLSSLRLPPKHAPDDTAVILYTSGTSGRPKGVPLSFGNLESNVTAGIERGAFTRHEVFLGVLPQFHSFGLTAGTLFPLVLGAKVVYSARFVPKKIVELFRLHRPTVFMAVPSMFGALMTVKDAAPDDFSSLKLCISGGEPLPQATRSEMKSRLGVQLMEGYGLTETSPVVSWSSPTMFKDGCVGKVLSNVKVVVVSDEGAPLAPGEAGEILISGPNVFAGYFLDPETTASVFTELTVDGERRRYFRTGDIGTLDPDGFLAITGRKKEMLIVGGLNVFPRGIEEVLNNHPSVKDSGVVGRIDGVRGEVPVAYVELKEGCPFDEASIRAYCREHLAGYKVPREIIALPELPRTPTGKVLRRKLKELPPK